MGTLLFYIMTRKYFRRVIDCLKSLSAYIPLMLVFILVPYIGNFVRAGAFYDSPISILDSLFRFCLILFVLIAGKLCQGRKIWKTFFFFHFLLSLPTILEIYHDANRTEGNDIAIIIILGSMYILLFQNHGNVFRFAIFALTFWLIYSVIQARTQSFSYLSFGLYMFFSKYLTIRLKKVGLLLLMFIIIPVMIVILIRYDRTSNVMLKVTSGRGAIWEHYLTKAMESPWVGFGHSQSRYITKGIPEAYQGDSHIKRAMFMGGPHNSYINMLTTRGIIGMFVLVLFVWGIFFRKIAYISDMNMGLFIFSSLLMFAGTTSTVGGLTYSSLIFLMSLGSGI